MQHWHKERGLGRNNTFIRNILTGSRGIFSAGAMGAGFSNGQSHQLLSPSLKSADSLMGGGGTSRLASTRRKRISLGALSQWQDENINVTELLISSTSIYMKITALAVSYRDLS